MSVLIQINGREAIPVRAIPLLTNWQTMTPDALAQALAGDDHYLRFHNMQAYRFDDGRALPAGYWTNNVVRPLMALSDTIRASEISHETGLQEFHTESLKKLPAGVYVWRDEFAQAHQRHYSKITLPLDCDGNDLHLTEGEVAKLTAEHQERITLDFSPFIDPATHALVMQGFGVLPADTAPEAAATPTATRPEPDAYKHERRLEQARLKARADFAAENVKSDCTLFVEDAALLINTANNGPAPAQTLAPVMANSDGPAPLPTVPAWCLKKPTRFQGYGKPLYDFFRAAHIAGQTKPNARDLLDNWKASPPYGITVDNDGFGIKYLDAKGNTKPADLEAIRKTINRMTR